MMRLPARSTLLPYTTLFRSLVGLGQVQRRAHLRAGEAAEVAQDDHRSLGRGKRGDGVADHVRGLPGQQPGLGQRVPALRWRTRSEEHTSELQSRQYLVCRLL